MPLDYETLRVIWWLILGILLIGFAIMDGFDLGVAMWLPWLAKTDMERRVLINSIGPTWEGNQVWFILGGGAIFAAWPMLYAISFSGFYLAMLFVLLALILRPVGFKYRSKLPNSRWRACWDAALFIGGFVPSLIFGVAVGNVLQGVPFYIDDFLRPFYTGTFFGLLNPFAVACGLVSVLMLGMHGANFINLKTENELQQRAIKAGRVCSVLTIILFGVCGFWLKYNIDGFIIKSLISHDGPSNPLYKEAIRAPGAWLLNYKAAPITIIVPFIGFVGAALSGMWIGKKPRLAFIASAVSLAGIIGTVGVSMFPFILPSSTHPNNSLIIWDSSSSHLTLFIMLVATVIFLPIVLAYTSWVYKVLRGKVTEETVINQKDVAY